MIENDYKILLKKEFLNLKYKEVNEEIVLNLINSSTRIFNNYVPFRKILNQSNREPDFESLKGMKLDTKIILPGDFWQKWQFSDDPDSLKSVVEFINMMNNDIQGIDEFFKSTPNMDSIKSRESINNSIIRTLEYNKDIILFFPFPISKYKMSYTNIFDDSIQFWISKTVNKYIGKLRIYVLALTMENCFYLYEVGNEACFEFLDYDFSEYLLVLENKMHIEN